MTNEKNFDTRRDTTLRAFSTWAVIIAMTISGFVAMALIIKLFWTKPSVYEQMILNNVRAVVGIPLAAASAFCVILLLEARAGRIEFEALGFKFRGAAAPAIIRIFAFLAVVAGIRLLWGNS
jgi:hypothetical protein